MQVIAAMPEDQQSSISYLAERMILRHNSMVELVDRAERSGLVRREHDEKDLRRSLVQLTPQRMGDPAGAAGRCSTWTNWCRKCRHSDPLPCRICRGR
jgi:hypothetical protein